MKTGKVFKIQKYSIHDGPGIRTAVFLKGCPLGCLWCHNPEGCRPLTDVVYHENRCIGCGRCVEACSHHAISLGAEGLNRDKEKCGTGPGGSVCAACVQACPSGALESVGREMTVSEVMEKIKSDLIFYEESGGGVTFTGGEPFLQAGFLEELVMRCFSERIHTAVETSGYTSWDNLQEISRYVGLFLYDLKLMNEEKHKKYTGVSNRIILENLEKLAGIHGNIVVRLPLIPGVNDDDENTERTCLFLKSIRIREADLLPYHNTGIYKYEQLGLPYRLMDTGCPDKGSLESIAEKYRVHGISIRIGG